MWKLSFLCLAACVAGNQAQINLDSINLPPGFSINVFSAKTSGARSLAISKNISYPGTILYVSTDTSADPNHRSQNGTATGAEQAGRVYGVLDSKNSGTSEGTVVLLNGQNNPNGIAWHNGSLYVAQMDRITRYDHADAHVIANMPFDPAEGVLIFDKFPNVSDHASKYIRVSPTGRLFFDVGAPCNDCRLTKAFGNITFGSINSMALNGTDIRPWAEGVRNTVGYDWDANGTLYFTNNGIDQLGNDEPDDTLNVAPKPGLFFGFPYCHTEGVGSPYDRTAGVVQPLTDPQFSPTNTSNQSENMAFCQEVPVQPIQAMGPHVATLGMRFWYGAGFPQEYNRSIFVAEHGSWARQTPIGYRVMNVRLRPNGTVAAAHEVFAEGWLGKDGKYWGRPVDVEVSKMGLFISDENAGAVYRVAYNSSFDAAAAALARQQITPYEAGPP